VRRRWARRARKHGVEPWPGEALPPTATQAERWCEEWELLGFLPGAAIMTLLRTALPADLDDSRAVEQAAAGSKVRLAVLVAYRDKAEGKAAPLTLLDEWGLVDADLPAQLEAPGEAGLVLVEGKVEHVFGAPIVRAAKVGRCLPAGTDGRVAVETVSAA
jgi:hypothetical protein